MYKNKRKCLHHKISPADLKYKNALATWQKEKKQQPLDSQYHTLYILSETILFFKINLLLWLFFPSDISPFFSIPPLLCVTLKRMKIRVFTSKLRHSHKGNFHCMYYISKLSLILSLYLVTSTHSTTHYT